jgi:hypothetical protein
MDNRISSEARRAKRNERSSPQFNNMSLKFRQIVWAHLRRKFGQLLACIERFSGGGKQRIRFDQVTINPHTCLVHSRKIELRVGISAVRSPAPQFDGLLQIPTDREITWLPVESRSVCRPVR